MRALMPLRIPAGWAVIFNGFVEFPEDDPPSREETESYRGEDILSIQQIVFTGEGWSVDTASWFVDLGWYPGGDPLGSYRLCLVGDGWGDVKIRFEHRSCYVIQRALNRILRMVSDGKKVELIGRVLADPRFPTLPPELPSPPA
ncbi:hypothetical protein ACFYU9_19315 [Streptomyces sp. NPDC004327]|uniref:hypothetical protein n=1 Tax=Streptomyces sp. NPDC004327 TaxID=3364699 RepID=UPI0036B7B890